MVDIFMQISYIAFSLNGWGATLLDSIDTMILLRLDDLVEKSIIHVSKLKLDRVRDVLAVFMTPTQYFSCRTHMYNSLRQSFVTLVVYFQHTR